MQQLQTGSRPLRRRIPYSFCLAVALCSGAAVTQVVQPGAATAPGPVPVFLIPASNGAGIVNWQHAIRDGLVIYTNTSTGNVMHAFNVTGFFSRGVSPDLGFEVYHNSCATDKTIDTSDGFGFGAGWSHTFAESLEFLSSTSVRHTAPDGAETVFTKLSGSWTTRWGRLQLKPAGSGWEIEDHRDLTREFDALGRLSGLRSHANARIDFIRDGLGKITRATDASGRYLTFNYTSVSGGGTRLDSVSNSFSPGGTDWSFSYDTQDRLSSIDYGFGTVVNFLYDSQNRFASYTSPAGDAWSFEYDTKNRVTKITDPGTGIERAFVYTKVPGEQSTVMTDRRGQTWTYVSKRTKSPRMKRTTDANGNTWAYDFRSDGQIKTATSPTNDVWTMTYDGSGNIASSTDPLNRVASYTHSSEHVITSFTDADGNRWDYSYDDGSFPHNCTKVEEPAVDGIRATTLMQYHDGSDPVKPGRLECITGPMGEEARYGYDAYGQLAWIEEGPQGAAGRIHVAYDFGTSGYETIPTYLNQGGMSYPSFFPTLPASHANIQGQLARTAYEGDDPASLTSSVFSSVTVPVDSGSGWESSFRDQTVVRDAFGRVVSRTLQTDEGGVFQSRVLNSSYNDATGSAVFTNVDGVATTVLRDPVGRVISITTQSAAHPELDSTVTMGSDANDRVTSVSSPSGHDEVITYYANGLLKDVLTSIQGVLVDGYRNTYDSRNLLEKVIRWTSGIATSSQYEYDERGRLTLESGVNSGGSYSIAWSYDQSGNRTEMVSTTGAGVERTVYHYDYEDVVTYASHNGRLMWSETDVDGTPVHRHYFFYNHFGHICNAVKETGTFYEGTFFEYDEVGLPWLVLCRSWTDTGGGPSNLVNVSAVEMRQDDIEHYLVRHLNPVTLAPVVGADQWILNAGNLEHNYDSGGNALAGVTQLGLTEARVGSGTTFLSRDLVGSASITSDGSTVTSFTDRDAFGRIVQQIGTPTNAGLGGAFGAHETSSETPLSSLGLVAMGVRLYWPGAGRFVMRDPLGFFESGNPYAFAGNRPTTLFDPTGMAATQDGDFIGPPAPQGGGSNVCAQCGMSAQDIEDAAYRGMKRALDEAAGQTKYYVMSETYLTLKSPLNGLAPTEAGNKTAFRIVEPITKEDMDNAVDKTKKAGKSFFSFSMSEGYGKGIGAYNCFVAGTTIALVSGATKPIEDVRIGDEVLCYDPVTARFEPRRVRKTISPMHDDLVTLDFGDVTTTNTTDHAFWVATKGWCSVDPEKTAVRYPIFGGVVGQLQPGDSLLRLVDGKMVSVTLAAVERQHGKRRTYNFYVDGTHTYIANGILTHTR
jgi:RHS repeat-associated protein